jgi:hypothetical protein
MDATKRIGKDRQNQRPRPVHERGHRVESALLRELGLTVYVPSASELRDKSDIIRPFGGKSLVSELEFWCAADAGTVLMRLIEMFGLPNAPEYHDWSDEFMDFKREATHWEYIFEVNKEQYFFVSHDHAKVTVGCKTTPDKKMCEVFFRFIASELNRSPITRNGH